LLFARQQLKVQERIAKEESQKRDAELRKRDADLEILKAMLAECSKLNAEQDRVFGAIQSMLPKTVRECFEEIEAELKLLAPVGVVNNEKSPREF